MAGRLATRQEVTSSPRGGGYLSGLSPLRRPHTDSPRMNVGVLLQRLSIESTSDRRAALDQLLERLRAMGRRNSAHEDLDDPQLSGDSSESLALFQSLALALGDHDWEVRHASINLICELVNGNFLQGKLDDNMAVVLPQLIPRLGDMKVTVRRAAAQCLHVYLKRTADFDRVVQAIVRHGLDGRDAALQRDCCIALPMLLTPDLTARRDFFEVVQALVRKLISPDDILAKASHKALDLIHQLLGDSAFSSHIHRLTPAMRKCYRRMCGNSETSVPSSASSTAPSTPAHYADQTELRERGSNHSASNKNTLSIIDQFPTSKRSPLVSKAFPSAPSSVKSHTESDTEGNSCEEGKTLYCGFIAEETRDLVQKGKDPRDRFNAVEQIKSRFDQFSPHMTKVAVLPHLHEFISLAENLLDDSNFHVAKNALEMLCVLVERLGPALYSNSRHLVYLLGRSLGDPKVVVQVWVMKYAMTLVRYFDSQTVLMQVSDYLNHKNSRVRQEALDIVIAALLQFPSVYFDLDNLCTVIAPVLVDRKNSVRQGALECSAVIAHLLGPGKLAPLVSSVDAVEIALGGEPAVMEAVQTRLARRQLPHLTNQGLVEYAVTRPISGALEVHDLESDGETDRRRPSAGKPPRARSKLPWEQQESNATNHRTAAWTGDQRESVRENGSHRETLVQPFSKATEPTTQQHSPKKSITSREALESNEPMVNRQSSSESFSQRHVIDQYEELERPSNPVPAPRSAPAESMPGTLDVPRRPPRRGGTQAVAQNSVGLVEKHSLTEPQLLVYGLDPLLQNNGGGSYRQLYLEQRRRSSVALGDATSGPLGMASPLPQPPPEPQPRGVPPGQKLAPLPAPRNSLAPSDQQAGESPIPLKPALARSAGRRRSSLVDDQRPLSLPITEGSKTERPIGSRHYDSGLVSDQSNYSPSTTMKSRPSDSGLSTDQSNASTPVPRRAAASPVPLSKGGGPSVGPLGPEKLDDRNTGKASEFIREEGEMYSALATIRRSASKKKAIKVSEEEERKSAGTTRSEPIDSRSTVKTKYNPYSGSTFKENPNYSGLVIGRGYNDDTNSDQLERKRYSRGLTGIPIGQLATLTSIDLLTGQSTEENPTEGGFNVVGKSVFDSNGKSWDDVTSSNKTEEDEEADPNISRTVKERLASKKQQEQEAADRRRQQDAERRQQEAERRQQEAERRREEAAKRRQRELEEKLARLQEERCAQEERKEKERRKMSLPTDADGENMKLDGVPTTQNGDDLSPNHLSRRPGQLRPNPLPPPKSGEKHIRSRSTQNLSKIASSPSEPTANTETATGPVPNAEKALPKTLALLARPEWEEKVEALNMMHRLVEHHAAMLASRPPDLHQVNLAVIQECKNLRSQVSRVAIQLLSRLFRNLGKAMDVDLDHTSRVLLHKAGESSVFIRDDVEAALLSLVECTTPQRATLALIQSGGSHKNAIVRRNCSFYLSILCEKLGAGRILSGVKDLTDKVLPTAAQFVLDGNPETRYYGRKIFSIIMNHPEFNKVAEKNIPANTYRNIRDIIDNLRMKGIGDPPSSTPSATGTRSMSLTRSISAGSSGGGIGAADPAQPTTPLSNPPSAPSSAQWRPARQSETVTEQVGQLVARLGANDWRERHQGINDLVEWTESTPDVVAQNVVKIFDKVIPRLLDSNSKVNLAALQAMLQVLPALKSSLSPVLTMLVQHTAHNLASKNPEIAQSASQVLSAMMENIEGNQLIQPFVQAVTAGNPRVKPEMILHLDTLVDRVCPRKPKLITLHVLPELWRLLHSLIGSMGSGVAGNPQVRQSTHKLVVTLYNHLNDELVEATKANLNTTPKVMQLLNEMIANRNSLIANT